MRKGASFSEYDLIVLAKTSYDKLTDEYFASV